MKKIFVLFTFTLSFTCSFAQQPNISNVDPLNGYPLSTVNIAGSGFGSVAGNVTVWFGGVEGTITSINDNLIQVTVPASAPNDNITVLNTSSGLLDVSNEKFFVSHSGSMFNVSELGPVTDYFASSTELLFDLCSCDFDNDGLVDIATTVSAGDREIKVLKNTSTIGSISFTELDATNFPIFNVGQTLRNIGCADLNGDGKIDIFASRNGQEKIYVFENTNTTPGVMSFTKAAMEINMTASSVPYQPIRIDAQDLNNDGRPELVVTNNGEGTFNILINESSGAISFNPTQKIIDISNVVSNTGGLSIEDMDGDGRADLVLTRLLSSGLMILRNTGVGNDISFAAPYMIATTGVSVNATTADYNNDGLLDIASVDLSNAQVQLFQNNSTPGSLSFGSPVFIPSGSEPWIARSGDMNGDGLLDMVISSIASANYVVAINNGTSFNSSAQSMPRNTRNINVNDYDGDGKADISMTAFAASNYALQVVRSQNCYDPVILDGIPMAICPGQTFTLEAPNAPGATFNWRKDGTLQKSGAENFLTITTFGVYEVEAITEGGACINTASITVANGSGSIASPPTASNNGPSCVGGDVTLSVNTVTGATYQWSGPNGFTSTDQNPVITNIRVSDAGSYTVRVKIGDCLSDEASTTLVVNESTAFDVTTNDPTTVCEGTTVQLMTQNIAGFDYQWIRDGVDIAGATTSSYVASTTGDYAVKVNDNGGNCQTPTNSVTVNVVPQPVADFTTSGTTCSGSDIVFTNSSTVDPAATVTYSWDFGDGTAIGTSFDEVHNYSTPGSYTVSLTVMYTGDAGCSSSITSQTVTVVDGQPLTVQSSQAYICQGEEVNLSIPSTFTNPVWNNGFTSSTIGVTAAGDYTIMAADPNGCTVSASYTLVAGPVPTVAVTANGVSGDFSAIEGEPVQLEATGADSYSWSPVDFLSDPTIFNPVATPSATTTYMVTGSLTDGCSSSTQITLIITPEGQINIVPLKAFSPNSTIDPTWRVDGVENYPNCTMSIFDERGTLVYRKLGYSNEWDATYEGSPVPEGVYYFVFSCEEQQPVSGSILVVR